LTLTGKTAVVTGASSGIGEATARLLVWAPIGRLISPAVQNRMRSLQA
jgi:NAD(P)-dependent dehydrogenase (short-subunit alcohol dehydrogenase family)